MATDKITIKGAREHNLKNVSLEIPRNQLVVFTGVSGSGKSSLAFDTISRKNISFSEYSHFLIIGKIFWLSTEIKPFFALFSDIFITSNELCPPVFRSNGQA